MTAQNHTHYPARYVPRTYPAPPAALSIQSVQRGLCSLRAAAPRTRCSQASPPPCGLVDVVTAPSMIPRCALSSPERRRARPAPWSATSLLNTSKLTLLAAVCSTVLEGSSSLRSKVHNSRHSLNGFEPDLFGKTEEEQLRLTVGEPTSGMTLRRRSMFLQFTTLLWIHA